MSAKTKVDLPEQRFYKALGHPLRQRILVALNKRESSPSELAELLDEPLGNVSYHVKILRENDAVELVKTQQVRGAVEHFYRATARPEFNDEHWARLPVSVRRALFDQTLQQAWDHVSDAAREEGFDDERAHVSWTPLDLDEQGYTEVVDLLAEMLERVMEIQAGARNRQVAGEASERRTEIVILHFDRAEKPA